MKDTINVVAHRGIHQAHPENSLEAFIEAWRQGIEWCECDVRPSAEDEPYILHDETLDRTTSGRGLIAQTPAPALAALNLRRADGQISASVLPSLASVLEAMPAAGRLLIEIKPKVSEAVVRRTLDMCDASSCIVQSFDRDILILAERFRPAIRRVLLVDDPAAPTAMQPGPWEGINCRHDRLRLEQVNALRETGLAVGVWTPNESADLRRAIGLDVDTIISDQPIRAAHLLRALLTLKGTPGA